MGRQLIHIKCCFSNFPIVRLSGDIEKNLAPQEKVEMTPLHTISVIHATRMKTTRPLKFHNLNPH